MRRPVVLIGAAVAVAGLVLLSWLGGGDDDETTPSPAASAEPVADNAPTVNTSTSSTTTTVPSFRLVTVRPGDGAEIPTGVQALVFLFSDAVDPDTASRLQVSPTWQGQARVLDRSVLYEPAVPWAEGPYTASLSRPTATDGSVADDATFSFTVVAPAPPDPATAPIEDLHPVVRLLPRHTESYRIDYEVLPDRNLKLVIRLYAILNREDQLPQYEDQLRTYKAEALEFLRFQGVEPSTYEIQWLPPEAQDL